MSLRVRTSHGRQAACRCPDQFRCRPEMHSTMNLCHQLHAITKPALSMLRQTRFQASLGLLLLLSGVAHAFACGAPPDLLPQLVEKSGHIVRGVMHLDSGETRISVTRTLKGDAKATIHLDRKSLGSGELAIKFTEGEECLLFLQTAGDDGMTPLLGVFGKAKLPYARPNGLLATTNLADLTEVVAKIQTAYSLPGLEQRLRSIVSMLRSTDDLTALVGLHASRTT